jgi:hypothetical protein
MTQGLRRVSSGLRAGDRKVLDVDQTAATKHGLAACSTQYATYRICRRSIVVNRHNVVNK